MSNPFMLAVCLVGVICFMIAIPMLMQRIYKMRPCPERRRSIGFVTAIWMVYIIQLYRLYSEPWSISTQDQRTALSILGIAALLSFIFAIIPAKATKTTP